MMFEGGFKVGLVGWAVIAVVAWFAFVIVLL